MMAPVSCRQMIAEGLGEEDSRMRPKATSSQCGFQAGKHINPRCSRVGIWVTVG